MNRDLTPKHPIQPVVRNTSFQRLILGGLLPVTLLAPASPATAQNPPDAGALRQQLEQNRLPELPKKSLADLAPAPEPLKDFGSTTRATVKQFQLRGNTLLPGATLLAPLAPYLNRPLSFIELQGAAAEVAAQYRQRGWVVRAYLPSQDISEGVFTIQIIEAAFGKLRVEDGAQRLPLARIKATVAAVQASAAPLNADRLDRALLLLNDTPGLSASGTLMRGEREGETDLILKLADRPFMRSEFSADNTGADSTGKNHFNASLTLNSAFGMGDAISIAAMHSRGSDYGRVAFSLPLGFQGARMGANASSMRYKLVSDQYAGLDVHGASTSVGLETSYPLLRSRLKNAFASLAWDHKRYDNKAAATSTSQYGVNNLSLTLSGNAYDELGGSGVTSGSFGLIHGRVDLDGSANAAADAAGPRVAGAFTKLRYALARQQSLGERWSLNAALSGQAAQKNLDSSEKFYLGGPTGVRAYPSGEAGGADGMLLNLELRTRLPHAVQLSGFYDWGRISVNHDNDFAGGAAVNRYSLQGAGMALAWAARPNLYLQATWARSIGSNPNRTASGADQDGSRVVNRFWLQASASF